MSTDLSSLRRWEIPDTLRIEPGEGGLVRINVTTKTATAHIYLHGAHVTHHQAVGQSPTLFLSSTSRFAPGKAIRGGVPVIFPWFGAHAERSDLPMHGFARSMEWELESTEKWPDETVAIVLRLVANDATRALWPYDFVLRHRIFVARKLTMSLEVENWSAKPFRFEEALHTYLAVRDVKQVAVTGLEETEYLDKVDGFRRKKQDGAIRIEGETDRVYLNTATPCLLDDPAAARRVLVAKEGSATTVVWNPWEEKAAGLADLENEDWLRMICIETVNATENAITLAPQGTHVMKAILSVES
jgi:glucose-6-phosphate 1-epimerase